MPAASPGRGPGQPIFVREPRVFYGWIVVAAAFLILFMAYGTQYAFGVFFAALVDEFGLVLQATAFVGFSQARELSALYATSLVFGSSYGAASTLFTAAVTDFFGREHAASLAGLLFALAASMAAFGPFGAGLIYDRSGDYRLAWWLGAGFNALALALLAFTRPPAPWECEVVGSVES
jgi:MFS family permease